MLNFQSLADFALLHITGADSERFLQGQLTCDVVALAPQHWTLGACCNAKGRMVANFVIAKTSTGFWLRLPKLQVEALKQHLSRYIVFFKAQMHSHLNQPVYGSLKTLKKAPERVTEPLAFVQQEEGITLSWPDGRSERWLFAAQNTEQAPAFQQAWHSADIRQGLVWVTADSQLEWLPQEIDWQEQGGVSFNKGCYTGQEIVARLQFLGKSKKHLVQLNSAESLTASILTPIHDENGQEVGKIVAWQQQQGLAILNKKLQQQQLHLAEHKLQCSALFYQPETMPTQE